MRDLIRKNLQDTQAVYTRRITLAGDIATESRCLPMRGGRWKPRR